MRIRRPRNGTSPHHCAFFRSIELAFQIGRAVDLECALVTGIIGESPGNTACRIDAIAIDRESRDLLVNPGARLSPSLARAFVSCHRKEDLNTTKIRGGARD
jgi:hypothetical protein